MQAEATAQTLGEVAQAQQELRDSIWRLEAQLRGTWLGHTRQELESLKVRGSQSWGGICTRISGQNSLQNLEPQTPPSSMASILSDPGKNPCAFPYLSFPICK